MIALVFPGQGSQKVGMGRALADELPSVARLFAEADDALGFALSRLCFNGPEGELQLTANTQPAILTTSIAALLALRELAGPGLGEAHFVAGHSLGEYSALVAAGALAFADAVRLVHQRGRFMQEAVPAGSGAMAAVVGLDGPTVAAVCAEAVAAGAGDEVCAPANFNGAGQVVIAGHAAAVTRAMGIAKGRGAKLVKALPVSAPFHSPLMRPAAERLAAEIAAIPVQRPRVPVVANVTAEPTEDPALIRRLLVEQVTAPVRWEESVQRLASLGATRLIELGPGKVLSGLVKRILSGPGGAIGLHNVETPADARALAAAKAEPSHA